MSIKRVEAPERSVTIEVSGEDLQRLIWLSRLNVYIPAVMPDTPNERKEWNTFLSDLRKALEL
jgi:hypothetical protein